MLLDDRPSLSKERIAGIRSAKMGRMYFDFISDPTEGRAFMTLSAGIGVEQRSEAVLRSEHALKHFFSRFELGELIWSEMWERVSQSGLLIGATAHRRNGHHQRAGPGEVLFVHFLHTFD
jgi:hypothetical protein